MPWFPPDTFVRICVTSRVVDAMDCFSLVSTSHAAAKVMKSKFLGAKNITSTAKAHGFIETEVKQVVWQHCKDHGLRTALPIDSMVSILNKVETAVASKLVPDLKEALQKSTECAIVQAQDTQEASPAAVMHNSEVVSHNSKITQISQLPLYTSDAFRGNPYNSSVEASSEQAKRCMAAMQVQKLTISAIEEVNDHKRKQEIADTETRAKKQKIEAEIATASELAQWKLNLDKLSAKYEWAMSHERIQLAAHIEKLIQNS